jgi:hypothetical protein
LERHTALQKHSPVVDGAGESQHALRQNLELAGLNPSSPPRLACQPWTKNRVFVASLGAFGYH